MQEIHKGKGSYKNLESILQKANAEKILLVCGLSFDRLFVKDYINNLNRTFVRFSDFNPNPTYESVVKGVNLFKEHKCDTILAIGGGSSIDVAKCIKFFAGMDATQNYLNQSYRENNIKLIAFPTTAGTGSESTKYAVIYYNNEKQSLTHESIIPDFVILDPEVLNTLPLYQKKCTVLDALCQAIESYWSIYSNHESKLYSGKAIPLLINNAKEYFEGNDQVNNNIMLGSNYAGKAINITQTTAAHAMSYKITTLFGLPHGHAVAICLPYLWEFMYDNLDKTIDSRGKEYVITVFHKIARMLNQVTVPDAIKYLKSFLCDLDIKSPIFSEHDLLLLSKSVNITRLKNNPIVLSESDLYYLYKSISSKE